MSYLPLAKLISLAYAQTVRRLAKSPHRRRDSLLTQLPFSRATSPITYGALRALPATGRRKCPFSSRQASPASSSQWRLSRTAGERHGRPRRQPREGFDSNPTSDSPSHINCDAHLVPPPEPRVSTNRTRARAVLCQAATQCPSCGGTHPDCGNGRCDKCGNAACNCSHASAATRRAMMAQFTFVPVALLLGAKPAEAGGLPSPTNQDDMEKRKMAREEMLKAARAKAAAQAAAEAPPPPPPSN